MFYVQGLQEWVLMFTNTSQDHMHDHPAAWKIPQEIIDNNNQWEIFAALVHIRLTSLHSQFKDRIFKAYAKGLDINQILFKLAPKQAVILDIHCARWSWIVLSIDDFKEACKGGKYDSGDFWTYLEDELASTKKLIASNPLFNTQDLRTTKFAE
ncbi:hypothetical protein FRC10_006955 [Ceratobasidium sp. 414]|nr:hypothetical protein FRC10_006955 [Ceratobasidium sp. 414]